MSFNIDLYMQIAFSVVIFIAVINVFRKRITLKKAIAISLFALYIYITFGDLINVITIAEKTSLKSEVLTNLTNMENMILFMPLGFFVSLMSNKKHTLKPVLVTSILVSATLSLIFFSGFILGKTFTYEMVIFNIIGAILGYVIFRVFVFLMHLINVNTNLEDTNFINKKRT